MISNFNANMPFSEIVAQSLSGVLFFHNHNHGGSYQILERSMPAFQQANVKYFYLEIPALIFQSPLTEHFKTQGKSTALAQAFKLIKESQRKYLQPLVEAAHAAGIQTLAVDINPVINNTPRLASETEKIDTFQSQRLSQDDKIAELMKEHMKGLSHGEKYIGLFGGNHIKIGQRIKACLINIHAMPLEEGKDHLHVLPTQVKGGDEQSDMLLKQFDMITFVPHDLDDKLDLSQPVTETQCLPYLNRLLKALEFPPCQAFKYTKSVRLDAAFIISTADLNIIWPRVVKWMDPFAKRCETLPNDQVAIIFENINDQDVFRLVVSSLVNLQKKK